VQAGPVRRVKADYRIGHPQIAMNQKRPNSDEAESKLQKGIKKAQSVVGIRNRKQLQTAYLLAFNPLYLAYELKKARNTTEEHESLRELLPAALRLHLQTSRELQWRSGCPQKTSPGPSSLHRVPSES
jgi:hypothetical protein